VAINIFATELAVPHLFISFNSTQCVASFTCISRTVLKRQSVKVCYKSFRSKLLYTGTATEGSALMVADGRLKVDFLIGNPVQKVEI